MKKKLIKEPVFETFCWFVWDCSYKELKKWVKEKWNYTIKTGWGTVGKLIFLDSKEYADWIIWTVDNSVNEIIHETNHLVFSLMRFKEIPINKDTEEVFISLQRFYIDEMVELLKKKKRGKKKAG